MFTPVGEPLPPVLTALDDSDCLLLAELAAVLFLRAEAAELAATGAGAPVSIGGGGACGGLGAGGGGVAGGSGGGGGIGFGAGGADGADDPMHIVSSPIC